MRVCADPLPSPARCPRKRSKRRVFQAQAPPPMMRVRKRPASLTHPDVFPYGIDVPFKVSNVVPGNKYESARAFLSESPIQALRDMCFYLGMIP